MLLEQKSLTFEQNDKDYLANLFLEDIRTNNAKLPWEEGVNTPFLIINKTLLNSIIVTMFAEYPDKLFDIVHLVISKDSVTSTKEDFSNIDKSLISETGSAKEAIKVLTSMASPITHLKVNNDENFIDLFNLLNRLVTSNLKHIVGIEKDMVTIFNASDFILPADVDEDVEAIKKILCGKVSNKYEFYNTKKRLSGL